MSLIAIQADFLKDYCALVLKAFEMGYTVTAGELLRPVEMQQIYVKTGRSKTMDSPHLKKMAGDLNLFQNGRICTREQIKPLGDWWEAQHPKNRWGGNWRGLVDAGRSHFIDAPHFERML